MAKTKQEQPEAEAVLNRLEMYRESIGAAIEQFELNELDFANKESLISMKSNRFNYFLQYIFEMVFKADKKSFCNKKSILDYSDADLMIGLCDTYLLLCNKYNKVPTLAGYCYLTGISYSLFETPEILGASPNNNIIYSKCNNTYKYLQEETEIVNELGSMRLTIKKKIQNYQENSLFSSAADGSVMALALGKVKHGWTEGGQTIRIESGNQGGASLMDKYKSEAVQNLPKFSDN